MKYQRRATLIGFALGGLIFAAQIIIALQQIGN